MSGFLGVFREKVVGLISILSYLLEGFLKYMQFSTSCLGELPEECHIMLVVKRKKNDCYLDWGVTGVLGMLFHCTGCYKAPP